MACAPALVGNIDQLPLQEAQLMETGGIQTATLPSIAAFTASYAVAPSRRKPKIGHLRAE
jgi:hypothetical protein